MAASQQPNKNKPQQTAWSTIASKSAIPPKPLSSGGSQSSFESKLPSKPQSSQGQNNQWLNSSGKFQNPVNPNSYANQSANSHNTNSSNNNNNKSQNRFTSVGNFNSSQVVSTLNSKFRQVEAQSKNSKEQIIYKSSTSSSINNKNNSGFKDILSELSKSLNR
ncbi:unnamed protein product [[Candida] boidinii]|nr:hypothetical protein BVG19_g905 [[Candida] boidinii]OWB48698.1 hypothetical protein B5S27_g233 [[Candida] boidinii]GMF06941.1 unnamed protein product [[Candida] boidinii]